MDPGSGSVAEAHNAEEMTLEAWADLDEDEPGELVSGRLEEEEMTSTLHEAVVVFLIHVLRAWARLNGGWVFGSELKLAVSPNRGRKPDVSVYLKGSRVPAKRAKIARTPPSIAIEVLSPRPRDGRRDRVDKRSEYARFGVKYYWLVDPELQVIEIFELGSDGRYTLTLSASAGAHPVPGCEGLTLDLDALWTEVDRLPDDLDDEPADR
jgi:Uma2 family endonuclease